MHYLHFFYLHIILIRCLISEPSAVSIHMDSPLGWCTIAHCEQHDKLPEKGERFIHRASDVASKQPWFKPHWLCCLGCSSAAGSGSLFRWTLFQQLTLTLTLTLTLNPNSNRNPSLYVIFGSSVSIRRWTYVRYLASSYTILSFWALFFRNSVHRNSVPLPQQQA